MPRITHRARALSVAAFLLLALPGTTPLWAQAPAAAGVAARNTLPLKVARTETFTTSKGTWISLDVSPDGQTLVFDLLGDLYTMPASGGTATAITSGLAYDAQPRFSPDGKHIVFVSRPQRRRQPVDDVARQVGHRAAHQGERQSVRVAGVDARRQVHRRVEVRRRLAARPKLWLYNVDGGTGVPLLPQAPPQLKTVGAAFGNNGRYIWYAARQGDWQYNAIGAQYQLFVYDRENSKTSQMSTRGGSAFRPALSPDGKLLVYATRENTKTGLRIRDLETQQENWLAYPVQRDETESRAPLDAYPGYTFTPDSKAVVVTYGGEIWRVPVDKSAPAKIPFTADVKLEMGPEVKFAYRVDTNARSRRTRPVTSPRRPTARSSHSRPSTAST